MIIQNLYASKNKGFSLIELLITVAVITIVSVSSYMMYDNNKSNAKVTAEVQQLSDLTKKLDSLTMASNYVSLNNSTLQSFGLDFKSEFQQPVIQGLSPTNLSVIYNGLNEKECTDFSVKTMAKLAGMADFTTKVNQTVISVSNPVLVANNCQNNNNNQVELVFNKLSNTVAAVTQSPLPPRVASPDPAPIPPFTPGVVTLPGIVAPTVPTPPNLGGVIPGPGSIPTIPVVNPPTVPPISCATPGSCVTPPVIPPVTPPVVDPCIPVSNCTPPVVTQPPVEQPPVPGNQPTPKNDSRVIDLYLGSYDQSVSPVNQFNVSYKEVNGEGYVSLVGLVNQTIYPSRCAGWDFCAHKLYFSNGQNFVLRPINLDGRGDIVYKMSHADFLKLGAFVLTLYDAGS
jgi:hypothetical protein